MADHPKSLERALALIIANPDYRVLRRIKDEWPFNLPRQSVSNTQVGVAVDVETTGLVAGTDDVIELALQRFRYTEAGEITEIGVSRSWRQDPGRPVPLEISRLTGLTDTDVRGQKIDLRTASLVLQSADIIVAHNASFDRPFVDRLLPVIREKTWACTMTDVDWSLHGFEGRSLSHLILQCGWFYDGHRAANDVLALLYLLANPGAAGKTILAYLLEKVSETVVEVVAVKAPYEAKGVLRGRRYKWNESLRSWHKEIARTDLENELKWLDSEVYLGAGAPLVRAMGSHERYRGDALPL